MKTMLRSGFCMLILWNLTAVPAQPQMEWQRPPSITVQGNGEVTSAPDTAVVRLGATAQAGNAADAQTQINAIVAQALEKIRALGIAEEKIQTSGLSLSPVYRSEEPIHPRHQKSGEIIGYRASNVVEVTLTDMDLVGKVIDAGISVGANEIQGISFEIRDDTELRKEALQIAAREARSKAESIAQAMDVRLGLVDEIIEGGVNRVYGRSTQLRTMAAPEMDTPVQPGEVQIQANLTLRYRITQNP